MVKQLAVIVLLVMVAVSCNTNDKITGGEDDMSFTSNLTWADKEVATHTKMNTMTANDDDLDTRIKKCLLAGANSSGVTRAATGSKTGTVSGASKDISISFASDCDGGDPSFDSTPRIIPTLEITSGDETITVHVKNRSDSGFTARIVDLSTTGSTASFTIHFIAIGDID